MPISHSAQVVFIECPDAVAFAHNQFTSAVADLPPGQWQFSSWLDAQGRVRALFHLARIGNEKLLVFLRGGDANVFAETLRRFVFRSRVKLSVGDNLKLATGDALAMHALDMHDDMINLGCGTHSMRIATEVVDNDAWQLAQLREGWPWLPSDALDEFTPPALSLHRLGAIALDKGCYPGQEVVARLHYRGGNKRHLHRVNLSRTVADGSVLQQNAREFVRLLAVFSDIERSEALAVITDEIAQKITARSENTSDDGIAVTLLNTWQD